MLPEVQQLVNEIDAARTDLVRRVEHLTAEQGAHQPTPDTWSITEVIEHLVWAELNGLNSMMVAMEASRRGEPVWTAENPNRGKHIEEIVQRTWRAKETAPLGAEPKMGGPLPYWVALFRASQQVVERVAEEIRADELDDVIYPHFLSGPLTMRQRLEFLRYHMQHHMSQVAAIRKAMADTRLR
ncbi:MAG: DinB family protein [Trueperaceae bacterium]